MYCSNFQASAIFVSVAVARTSHAARRVRLHLRRRRWGPRGGAGRAAAWPRETTWPGRLRRGAKDDGRRHGGGRQGRPAGCPGCWDGEGHLEGHEVRFPGTSQPPILSMRSWWNLIDLSQHRRKKGSFTLTLLLISRRFSDGTDFSICA